MYVLASNTMKNKIKINEKIKYFVYCRKSSDAEDRQVQSIPDQINELRKLAKDVGIEAIEVFSESRSAKEPGRPVFDEMIKRIKKGEASGLIVWKLNRLARNPIDGGMISWLLQEGIIKHIQTYGRSYFPEDNVLMMQVELGMATQYVRDLSVDTKRGIRSREQNGLPNGVAPIGFRNDLLSEPGNRGWLVDEERFPLIRQLLELYATGRYSIRQLAHVANEEIGLRTPQRKKQGGKKLVISYVADTILKNPVFAGFFFTKDGSRYELQESLPRMITEEQYWHIQKIIGSKGRPRPSTNKLLFTYTGRTVCGGCGGSVTAEHKYQLICPGCRLKFSYPNRKNCPGCEMEIDKMEGPTYLHYIYYHCTKKKNPNCKEGSVQEVFIDQHLATYFKENLRVSKALSDWCVSNLGTLESSDQENEFDKKKALESTLSKKENEYKELVLMKAKLLISEDDFIQVKEPLRAEIESIKGHLASLGHVDPEKLKRVYRAFNLAQGIDEVFANGSIQEKKEVLSEIGSNLTLKDKKLSVSNAKMYEAIINGLLTAKTKNTRFEPESIVDTSSRNEVFVDVCPTLLRG